MTQRGGRRAGAGRKKGSLSIRTRHIAETAMNDGITPLEVMLGVMRQFWREGRGLEAADIAKAAAPYMHPRLAFIEPPNKPKEPTQEELREQKRREMERAEQETREIFRALRERNQ